MRLIRDLFIGLVSIIGFFGLVAIVGNLIESLVR